MDKILLYILIGLGGFLVIQLFTRLFAFYWKAGYEARKKKREEKKEEKRKWKYCEVRLDNPLLNQMISDRTIIFMGNKGKGKSKMMNLLAHFLYLKRQKKFKKNKRLNKYIHPDFIEAEQMLEEKNLLPVYSNTNYLEPETGATEQELRPYFERQLRAVENSIFCIDEVSSVYGKDLYQNNDEYTKEQKKDIKENAKKNRHYTDSWILGTEQDGADIFIGIRENGYAVVNCKETIVTLLPKGKFLRKVKNLLLLILPSIFTINLTANYRQCLFAKQKFILFCKSLLPAYITLPKEYYIKRVIINNKIKQKYQRFATRFVYDNKEWWIRYSNDDIFKDNTRAYKDEYKKLFDEHGVRKKEPQDNER